MQLQFATELIDFGERMAENDKVLLLEALRTRDNEVFCEPGHSLTLRCRVQLQFATELADVGE